MERNVPRFQTANTPTVVVVYFQRLLRCGFRTFGSFVVQYPVTISMDPLIWSFVDI